MLNPLSKYIARKTPVPEFKPREGLPSSWDEVTLKEFAELDRIQRGFEADENYVRQDARVIALFTGREYAEIVSANTVGSLRKLVNEMAFLKIAPPEYFPPTFKMEGKTYKVNADIKTVAGWQAIIASEHMKQGNLHYVMAALCWPVDENEPESTVEQRAQYFLNHLPISVAHGLAAFFLNNSTALLTVTQSYFKRRMKTKNRTGSLPGGDGLPPSKQS